MKEHEYIIDFIKEQKPLIHCITNPVSMNDCANVILALGAKPIMAEHPKEVADITRSSNALGINIGCITDLKMQAIMISGQTALESNIPSVIDCVGITCSKLRLDFALEYIKKAKPTIIKGNLSEIKTLCGLDTAYKGIDSNEHINYQNIDNDTKTAIKKLAMDTNATVVATGAHDFISDGQNLASLSNGSKYMSLVTGTGCMLNAVIATFMSAISDSSISAFDIAVTASLYLNTCGEIAADSYIGSGSYHIKLIDTISTLSIDKLNPSFINTI